MAHDPQQLHEDMPQVTAEEKQPGDDRQKKAPDKNNRLLACTVAWSSISLAFATPTLQYGGAPWSNTPAWRRCGILHYRSSAHLLACHCGSRGLCKGRARWNNVAIAVGSTIILCGLFAGPISGASMNPARSLGPFLVSGQLGDAWIYLVGPFAGALLAVGMAWLLRGETTPEARKAAQGD